MPHEKPDAAYLRDMVAAAQAVRRLTAGYAFESYSRDERTRLAVERAVQIIGEAARHVSDAFRAVHPDIAWTKIMRQRHRIVHDYDDIDDRLIWTVATVHVPHLLELLEPLVPPDPPDHQT